MKKINMILSSLLLAGASSFAAQAGVMGPATTVAGYGCVTEGAFVADAYYMQLSWDNQPVDLVEGTEAYCEIRNSAGEMVEKISGPYSIYKSYSGDDIIQFNLYFYGYNYPAGEYEVYVPAGIVENEAGDTNPEQTISFTLVKGNLSSYDSTYHVDPPVSETGYDYETGKGTPAPFYQADELSNVNIYWDGAELEATGANTAIYGQIGYYGEKVDLSDYFSIKNGKMVMDLSSLTPGQWNIEIPSGLAMTTTSDGIYINPTIYLTYVIVGELEPITGYEVTFPRTPYYVNTISEIDIKFDQPVRMVENAPAVTYTYGSTTENASVHVESSGSAYTLFVTPASKLEEAGAYTFTIPAGVVTNGKYFNEEIKLDYYILEFDENYTVTPANKSALTTADFGTITITYPDVEKIEVLDSFEPIRVRGGEYGDYTIDQNLTIGNGVEVKDNTIIISIPGVEQIDYWVDITWNSFKLDDNYTNNYINLEYSVWDGMQPATFLEGPGYDARVGASSAKWLLTWDYQQIRLVEGKNVTMTSYSDNEPVEATVVQIEDPEGGTGYGLLIDAEETALSIIESETNYNHEFTFKIPAGLVVNENDEMNPAQSVRIRIYEDSPEVWQLQPQETPGYYALVIDDVDWMSRPEETPITVTTLDGKVVKTLEDVADDEVGYWRTSITIDEEYTPVVMVNTGQLDNGRYYLNVPEGFVLINIIGTNGFPDYAVAAASLKFSYGQVAAEAVIKSAEVSGIEPETAVITAVCNFFDIPEGGKAVVEATEYETRETLKFEVEVVDDEATAVINLKDLTENTEYTYMIVARIYDADGNIVTASPAFEITFTTPKADSVEFVGADEADARYFNLQGVEVKNPAPGQIYIKVINGKAVKTVK